MHMHAAAIRKLLHGCAFVREDNPLAEAVVCGVSSRTYTHTHHTTTYDCIIHVTLPTFLCSMLFINFDKIVSFQVVGTSNYTLIFQIWNFWYAKMYNNFPKREHSFKIPFPLKNTLGIQRSKIH